MINTSNYYERIKAIDWNAVPASLKKIHERLIPDAAKNDWSAYNTDGDVKRVVDKYFGYISKFVPASIDEKLRPKKAAVRAKPSKPTATPKEKRPKVTKVIPDLPEPKQVIHIATATAFIKRYAALHGKVKTRDQILALTHGLQKAITEQRIKSGDPAMREIEKMQSELIALATTMGESAKIEIDASSLTHYKQIAQGEEVRTSVKLLKQFIQINGKTPDKAKAETLGKKMAAAYDSIPKEDLYLHELKEGAKALADYVHGNTKSVSIPKVSLHGLSGIAGASIVSSLGRVTGGNAVISLLRDADVKDLKVTSMTRAFCAAKAPGLCLEIARLMIRRGELTTSALKGAQPTKKLVIHSALSGADSENEYGDFPTDILEMQLVRSSVATKSLSGLGNTNDFIQNNSIRRASSAAPSIAVEPTQTITARDLAKMRFKTIGYHGRFKDVVGDPALGFHMMVYGKPFQGKSSFVIELCKDLAALGKGRIAYLALEEGISASMQKKVLDRGADKVDGLNFLGVMPTTFGGYNFIVIDSVSDRSMKRETLRELFLQNPDTCFICIFHATKEGTARGGLDYSHDMDIILKIENHIPSVEKNRFL